jgi:hypothetical protein
MAHSCGRYRLADHFRGQDRRVREMFERLRALVRRCGPATVYAQKTRIVFQVKVRFAGAMPRKRWLDVGLWLTRRARHPSLLGIEAIVPNCYLHRFRFRALEEMDGAFAELVRRAYAVGRREHLKRRGKA